MDSDDGGGVRWVPSQSTNPALQALITEAERDRTARQPTWSSSPLIPRSSLPLRRQELSSSTSHPPRHPARPRPSPSTQKHVPPRDSEPEAAAFIELLKDTFKAVDENSVKKQRVVVREKALSRAGSRATISTLTRSASASASCPKADRPPSRASPLSAPPLSGKSAPASLPSRNLNPSLKHATRYPTLDSPMQDVIDLTDTDTDLEKPRTLDMDSDDQDGMDVSFVKPDPPPQIRPPAQKQKQKSQSRPPPVPSQQARTGPPPLGMRRAPQFLPSQHTPSQPSKGVTVPRFRPPLLANASVATNRIGSVSTPSPPPPRTTALKSPVTETTAQAGQDPDSSFDVSFDMDADALEEAMKAYD